MRPTLRRAKRAAFTRGAKSGAPYRERSERPYRGGEVSRGPKGSGDGGPQAIIGSGSAVAGPGDPGGANHEVGVGIHVAAVHVDDARLLDERFPVTQCQFDPILAGLELEREAAAVAGRGSLTLAGCDVDDLDRSAACRAGAGWTADRSGEDSVRESGFRRGVARQARFRGRRRDSAAQKAR